MRGGTGVPGRRGGRAPEPRRRAHALELVLAPPDDEAVRHRWKQLEEAGVPSAARHAGATHRPHVTVVSGPRPARGVLEEAAELLGPCLPADLPVVGLGLLGPPGRGALVELLAPSHALRTIREQLVASWPGADERPWLPHVTLAQRLGADAVAGALRALDQGSHASTTSRGVVGLRWWDPDAGTVMLLAGDDPRAGGPST